MQLRFHLLGFAAFVCLFVLSRNGTGTPRHAPVFQGFKDQILSLEEQMDRKRDPARYQPQAACLVFPTTPPSPCPRRNFFLVHLQSADDKLSCGQGKALWPLQTRIMSVIVFIVVEQWSSTPVFAFVFETGFCHKVQTGLELTRQSLPETRYNPPASVAPVLEL